MSAPRRRRPRSGKGPEPIATVLLRSSGDEPREGAPLPPRAWHDAVGERISRRTRPLRLDNKVLTVRAATAVWAQELSFLAPAIVKRLSALGFEVESLRFRVGPVEPPERLPRPPRVKTPLAGKPLSPELKRHLAGIDDRELREAIAQAASSNLAWQAARGPGGGAEGPRRVTQTATSKPRAAPAPRSAARENAPPAHRTTTGRGGDRDKP